MLLPLPLCASVGVDGDVDVDVGSDDALEVGSDDGEGDAGFAGWTKKLLLFEWQNWQSGSSAL